ncbi:MAG: radical SAM protein [Deltaproteobacteria bacterium]|nr:radical SAM protein [Deltaproteobacteria bacterium]MCB9788223.1 radical SAM protein [Deltaproteobacteria bacterium]
MAQGLKDAVLVRTGYGCNNACVFCNQGDWRSTRGDRSAEDVQADVIDGARRAAQGSGVLVLAGGEVTLRHELPHWIETARRHGARRVVVQTNGRMLAYPRFAETLCTSGADIFAVALHGPTAELHDWLTQAPGSFDQAVRGIRNVVRAGARVFINTVVTRSGFRHLPEVSALLPGLGASGIRFIWPDADGRALDLAPSVIPHPHMVAPHLWRAVALARARGCRVVFEGPPDFPGPEQAHAVHGT